jgi:hypothetical protein
MLTSEKSRLLIKTTGGLESDFSTRFSRMASSSISFAMEEQWPTREVACHGMTAGRGRGPGREACYVSPRCRNGKDTYNNFTLNALEHLRLKVVQSTHGVIVILY